jgi:transcriptional regulator with XRE-family HTH domain
MEKIINGGAVKTALAAQGWSQKQLASELGVSSQAVTNWLKGVDFPRPNTLLQLAMALGIGFDQLVATSAKQPVIAYRKKGNSKTTERHLLKAHAMGALLKVLVQYLPTQRALRTQIPSPSTDYEALQKAAADIREKVGIGAQAVLRYDELIDEFKQNGAVIIPVMWGCKQVHENALHIFLPDENVTFIYLNLDTYIEDFKFWMAHELAHVYTPSLAGSEDGENFADAFAGALLFPRELAQVAYSHAIKAHSPAGEVNVLQRFAHEHDISLFSVFCEVGHYARNCGLPCLRVKDRDIHAVRNNLRGSLVSATLFKPLPPDPGAYIAASRSVFDTSFFDALHRMVRERQTGAGYIQQALDISMSDATGIFAELSR